MNLHDATCPCGKRRYGARKTARRAIRVLYPGQAMREYRCGTSWHVGHLPEVVRRGYMTAAECYGRWSA